MSEKNPYRRCFVPLCTNTEMKNPNKIFFSVPRDDKRRQTWFKLAHRVYERSTTKFYCCEDHFNIKEDMENYIRYCMMGGYLKLKKNVVPHIFNCHENRRIMHQPVRNRCAVEKLNRKRMINDMLKENASDVTVFIVQSNISKKYTKKHVLCELSNNSTIVNKETPQVNDAPEILKDVSSMSIIPNVESEVEKIYIKKDMLCEIQNNPTSVIISEVPLVSNATESTYFESNVISFGAEKTISEMLDYTGIKKKFMETDNESNLVISKKIEIKKHFRSKCVSAVPKVTNAACQTKLSMIDKRLSPIIIPSSSSSNMLAASKSSNSASYSEYQLSTDAIGNMQEDEQLEMKRSALRLTNYSISVDSKAYIGIPNQCLWLIEDIGRSKNISTDCIKLILMKIKKNDSFKRLGDQFGLSGAGASRIFNTNIHKIANLLKPFIYFPNKKSLKKALPIPFRMNFGNIVGIIDCFEIQMKKPSNSVHQAQTWSEYKKCNTVKYLICISADGLVTFISSGYGGRVSDIVLFEDCKIMDMLPESSGLMADRGFKQIQAILDRKDIELIRPPSVSSKKQSSKDEVLITKRIASLRIHVERVIRRIREFSLLEPHSTLDHSALTYIDSAVVIASALINFQEPVIRT